MVVELGFCEETEPWRLHRAYFVSKVGGRPGWLNPDTAPKIKCDICQQSMILLMQMYSPREEQITYHRVIYIFTCRAAPCHGGTKHPYGKVVIFLFFRKYGIP